jgi:hypothetical protein
MLGEVGSAGGWLLIVPVVLVCGAILAMLWTIGRNPSRYTTASTTRLQTTIFLAAIAVVVLFLFLHWHSLPN